MKNPKRTVLPTINTNSSAETTESDAERCHARSRSRVLRKLVEAIEEVERLGKISGKRNRRGEGGISPKER